MVKVKFTNIFLIFFLYSISYTSPIPSLLIKGHCYQFISSYGIHESSKSQNSQGMGEGLEGEYPLLHKLYVCPLSMLFSVYYSWTNAQIYIWKKLIVILIFFRTWYNYSKNPAPSWFYMNLNVFRLESFSKQGKKTLQWQEIIKRYIYLFQTARPKRTIACRGCTLPIQKEHRTKTCKTCMRKLHVYCITDCPCHS